MLNVCFVFVWKWLTPLCKEHLLIFFLSQTSDPIKIYLLKSIKFEVNDKDNEPLFHCTNCMPKSMYIPFEQIVYHTFFCSPINYRSRCTYCGDRKPICECTRKRDRIKDTLEDMITPLPQCWEPGSARVQVGKVGMLGGSVCLMDTGT